MTEPNLHPSIPFPLRRAPSPAASARGARAPGARTRSALAILALAISTLALPAPADEIMMDGIAAQVGGSIVLASEVDEISRPIVEKMRAANVPESEIMRLKKDALERLIESRLMDEVVQQLELSATDAEIDAAIEGIARETGLSISQLKASVRGYGMSFEDYRGKIKTEIERNKVLNTMVRSKVAIEPSEVKVLYAKRYGEQRQGGVELHLRHILVTAGEEIMRDHATACRMVEDARAQIVAGMTDFPTIAQRISDANPESGGDLGWIHEDDLAGWMQQSIRTLDRDTSLSQVIDMPFGCNLLELVAVREFKPITLEEAKPEIEQELYRVKTEQEYTKWLNELREQTYIERKGIYAVTAVQQPAESLFR